MFYIWLFIPIIVGVLLMILYFDRDLIAQLLADIALNKKTGYLYCSPKKVENIKDFDKDSNSCTFFFEEGEFATGYSSIVNIINILAEKELLSLRKISSLLSHSNDKPITYYLKFIYELNVQQIKTIFTIQLNLIHNTLQWNNGSFYFQDSLQYPYRELTKIKIDCFELLRDFLDRYSIPLSWENYLCDKNVSLKRLANYKNIVLNDIESNLYYLADPNLPTIKLTEFLNVNFSYVQKKVLLLKLMGLLEETYPEDLLLRLTKRFIPSNKQNFDFSLPRATPKKVISFLSVLLLGQTGIFFLLILGLFQSWELQITDLLIRLRGTSPSQRIILVTQSDLDLEFFGRHPVSDSQLATVLENIQNQQPAVVGLDVYRNLSVPPGTARLNDLFENSSNLVTTYKEVNPAISPPPKSLLSGFADIVVDSDGVVRRNLLSVLDDRGNQSISFGLLIALIYLQNQENIDYSFDPQTEATTVGEISFSRLNEQTGIYWKADFGGYQIPLNPHRTLDSYQTISWQDVYQNKIPPDLFKDKIVILGSTADSLKDFFETSFTIRSDEISPGLLVHANAVESIIDPALGNIEWLSPINRKSEIIYSTTWLLLGCASYYLILQLTFYHWNRERFYQLVVIPGSLVVILSVGVTSFLNGIMLPVLVPFISFSYGFGLILLFYQSLFKSWLYTYKNTNFFNRVYLNYVVHRYFAEHQKKYLNFSIIQFTFDWRNTIDSKKYLLLLREISEELKNVLLNRGYSFLENKENLLIVLDELPNSNRETFQEIVCDLLRNKLSSSKIKATMSWVDIDSQSEIEDITQLKKSLEQNKTTFLDF